MPTHLIVRDSTDVKRWTVSIRPVGEDLAAESAWGPLRVVLVAPAARFSADEVRVRLDALVADALETAGADTGPRRVPAPLHHALGTLRRWRADTHGADGGLRALALYAAQGIIGVGHIGGDVPEIYDHETVLDVPWYLGAPLEGADTRGLCMYVGRYETLRLAWSVRGTDATEVEAWLGDGEPDVPFEEADTPREAAADPPRAAAADPPRAAAADSPRAPQSTPTPSPSPAPVASAPPSAATRSAAPSLPLPGPPRPAPRPTDGTQSQPALRVRHDIAFQARAHPGQAERATPATPASDHGAIRHDEGSERAVRASTEDAALTGRPSLARPIEFESLPASEAPDHDDEIVALPEEAIEAVSHGWQPTHAAAPPPVRPAPALRRRMPLDWRRAWPWAAAVAVLFAVGWVVGQAGDTSRSPRTTPSRWTQTMRSLGLGGAWADLELSSQPAGAWVAVDGKPLAVRTPATVEVDPGARQVTFSFDGLGEATLSVEAAQRRAVPLAADLRGSVRIGSADPDLPIAVEVDGEARGYAPLIIDGLVPGPHVVEFTGPGMPPWSQTVEVRVQKQAQVIARPFDAPETGLIEIRALLPGTGGPEDLRGAAIWVDGMSRGATPLVLELPRGPHSIRIAYGEEQPPVQVIDLPGGNQRFATFQMGTGADYPRMTFLDLPRTIPADRPLTVSVSVDGIPPRDVKGMWLHVRNPEGVWRRYPMAVMPAAGGAVGTVVFPAGVADANGRATFYASTAVASGDEYFTEIEGPASRPVRAARPPTASSKSRTP